MKDIIEITESLAKIVNEMENQRKKFGQYLRDVSSLTNLTLSDEVLEEKIIIPIQRAELDNIKIAGVDGGMVKKSFQGLDLILLRAIGVVFSYQNNKLSSVDYYPDAIPQPEPKTILDPFNDLEFEVNSNIERQIKEISTARETIEKFEPDVLFLNGSVIPQYTFVPSKGSSLHVNYKRMIDAYQKLFEVVKGRKTILAGATEDSRGTRFCEVLNDIMLTHFNPHMEPETKLTLLRSRDSNLLNYTLNHGERSLMFPYSKNPTKHPILREFSERKKIMCFYIKTAELDTPIRIEFFADKGMIDKANFISSILLSLSVHSGYGTPSVIIEADQRAKLEERDLELFYHDVINKTGNPASLLEQRRTKRPF
ncbi:MAG: DNA double-strand break repair nuclease NurA [Candidatus Aenigmarchaeota archaeon]|nr:DNA double-strand break repair nuclease NurA [Candidatus Aenigmarchaeota archaeon]